MLGRHLDGDTDFTDYIVDRTDSLDDRRTFDVSMMLLHDTVHGLDVDRPNEFFDLTFDGFTFDHDLHSIPTPDKYFDVMIKKKK